jgi:hypothetical protein
LADGRKFGQITPGPKKCPWQKKLVAEKLQKLAKSGRKEAGKCCRIEIIYWRTHTIVFLFSDLFTGTGSELKKYQ